MTEYKLTVTVQVDDDTSDAIAVVTNEAGISSTHECGVGKDSTPGACGIGAAILRIVSDEHFS